MSSSVLIIVGPTAVGKSQIAIELAERINGEIISADSRYLYRGMDIGTAKPDKFQLQRVRHHLIDVADIHNVWSLADFRDAALESINEINSRGKLALLVGGTGQYIRSIIEGWSLPNVPPSNETRLYLQKWLNEIGSYELHQKLAILDPEAGESIDYRNARRTMRALEVILISGKKFSELRQKHEPPFRYKIIGLTLPRELLYSRIDQRIDDMFRNGFVEEVKSLMKKGYSIQDPPMSAIGYPEVMQYLEDSITIDECIDQIKKKTRIFVRRQSNWFKSDDARIKWFSTNTNSLEDLILYIKDKNGWCS
jgi:tRNA dimethylallyltransferase